MNRDETLVIMGVLKAAYPAYYRDMSKKDALGAVSLWNAMFEDKPYLLVEAAVKSFIATDTKGFPPTIGMINAELARLSEKDRRTELEAWELVKQAAANSSWGHEYKSFDRLPPDIRRIVGSPQTLHEWGQMDVSEFNTVVASNFMRSFREYHENRRREAVLPQAVKSAAQDLAGRINTRLTGGGGGE